MEPEFFRVCDAVSGTCGRLEMLHDSGKPHNENDQQQTGKQE
jgi:hypothetical protein